MNQKKISEFQEHDQIEGVYFVREKILGVGKNGKSFLSIQLGDSTGAIDSRLWDLADQKSQEFQTGDCLKVRGNVQVFQSRKQFILQNLIKTDLDSEQVIALMPKSRVQSDSVFDYVLAQAQSVNNPYIQELLISTLQDEAIKPLLLRAPAAKTIHHAWIGGLIEHIQSLLKLMNAMSEIYPFLKRDFLIFGAIYHDLGKIWELQWDQGTQYTDRGRLIGHMILICEYLDKKVAEIPEFPLELKDLLKHIILGHHGKLEYGSPKLPQFLEAVVVAMMDEFDSKVSQIHGFISAERENMTHLSSGWSRMNENLGRAFLLDDFSEL